MRPVPQVAVNPAGSREPLSAPVCGAKWVRRSSYLPCQSGLRLPRKAEMPSLPSSEKKTLAKPLLPRRRCRRPGRRHEPTCPDLLDFQSGALTGQTARPVQGDVEELLGTGSLTRPASNASIEGDPGHRRCSSRALPQPARQGRR